MGQNEVKQAALELFALKGFDGCSMQDIADKVGINKATIYCHYSSKESLFFTVLEEQMNTYTESIRVTVQENIEAPIKTLLFEIVKAFFDNSPLDRLLLWKKTLLMVVSTADDNVINVSRQIMFKMNQHIFQIIKDVFASKNIDTATPPFSKFIESYYVFIQSVFEWILLNSYRMNKNVNTTVADLWENFWDGSKIG